MVRWLELPLRLARRLGTRASLGQHRFRRRRQGLQAPRRDDCRRWQERHRFHVQDRRYEKPVHDPLQKRSCDKDFDRYQVLLVFHPVIFLQVVNLFRHEGAFNGRLDGEVVFFQVLGDWDLVDGSHFRHHEDCQPFLQPHHIRDFYLQQAFHLDRQQVRKRLVGQHDPQRRQLQVLQHRILQQPDQEHILQFRQLFNQQLKELRRQLLRRRQLKRRIQRRR